jgi:hypothetical protein
MVSTRTSTLSVRIVSTVDEETAKEFYALYAETFGPMATKAVNRHVLYEHEFMETMHDERIDKYLAVDDDSGEAIGMCTLTNHLETVTWVSADYFAHHYPEHAARQAIYYLGFSLAKPHRRREQVFTALITAVSETLAEERAMCGYDICAYNNDQLRLGDAVEAMVSSIAEVEIKALDTQTYYAAISTGPLKVGNRGQVPEQRPTVEASP